MQDSAIGIRPIEDYAVQVMLPVLSNKKLFPDPDFGGGRIVNDVWDDTDD